MNKEDLIKIFKEYVETFDINEVAISRKYYHSLRVMNIASLISINEKFETFDQDLSQIVGLLHDYARFCQWTKYKTYSDLDSIDHGDLSVELLFNKNEIEKFNINKEYYDEIYDSIKYHNKYLVPENLSEHNKLLCKLIRDADKLDIFYLLGIEKELLCESDDDISFNIIKEFYKNKLLSWENVKNKNDGVLLKLAMVFDLNFKYSFKYLKDNKLIDKIYENISNKELFKEYFDYINKYIDERIE